MVYLGKLAGVASDDATAKIAQLEADKRALLSELANARAQLEHVLATLRMTYESVRSEQDREKRERH
jgi:hypothetical protein